MQKATCTLPPRLRPWSALICKARGRVHFPTETAPAVCVLTSGGTSPPQVWIHQHAWYLKHGIYHRQTRSRVLPEAATHLCSLLPLQGLEANLSVSAVLQTAICAESYYVETPVALNVTLQRNTSNTSTKPRPGGWYLRFVPVVAMRHNQQHSLPALQR